MTSVTIILFEITVRKNSLSFKQIFLVKDQKTSMLVKITTKHRSNGLVRFVTHKHFAVLFFLPSCCVNSLFAERKTFLPLADFILIMSSLCCEMIFDNQGFAARWSLPYDANTGFPVKRHLRNERRNSILMTGHYHFWVVLLIGWKFALSNQKYV